MNCPEEDMDPIEIVRLHPDEWKAYKALRLESLQNAPQAFGSTYDTNLARSETFWRGRLVEAQIGERGWLLFARINGQLVGIVGAYRTDEAEVVEVISTYITPAYRGRGVAHTLMDVLLKTLTQTGQFKRATLGVNQQQAAAVRLYERCGSEYMRTQPVQMGDGQTYIGVVMERTLDLGH
jgi:ribosomal protein S18 acetylase RimI-like enzyme